MLENRPSSLEMLRRNSAQVLARAPRQGIYLIPALITLGNMALGFFALTRTLTRDFIPAATAVLVGHILDALDGRIARWTNTASAFGVELDSLADFLTFCVAPAFMMYELVLRDIQPWGLPVALLFVGCGALRLAKFNTKAHDGEGKSTHFTGLPTPAAGGVLAIFALLYTALEQDKLVRSIKMVEAQVPLFYKFVPAIMFLLSVLMVSHVQYSTFKNINLLRPRSLRALVLILMSVLLVYVYPQNMIFIFYVSYIAWGLVEYFILGRSRRPTPPEQQPKQP
jgi:CDP-diacylglycerol---serine O-phosphatidyltransferase